MLKLITRGRNIFLDAAEFSRIVLCQTKILATSVSDQDH
jgi:hypothetical protein